MGAQPQPYMYDPPSHRNSGLPEKEFDPKAVTRASWEVKPKIPKKKGPLVAFGRHPDAQAIPPSGRTYNFRSMSDTVKWWIRWTRYVQLGFRALELIAAAGLLVLMILISNVTPLAAWILRIAPAVMVVNNAYGIWHLARPARARPPASSAAYQVFAGITDVAIVIFYIFGILTVNKESGKWGTILTDKALIPAFVESEYYTLLGAIGLHALSLGISIYLGVMFRRIANMPPDMNPLESNLTSRAHKRNKSSIYTAVSEGSSRLSMPIEDRRRSGAPYEDLSRPPSVPFMHTRNGSRDSMTSSRSTSPTKRDSRFELPSRQYMISPGSSSPRNSNGHIMSPSTADQKRMSNPKLAQRGSYVEIPLPEAGSVPSSPTRPGSSAQPANASPTRVARFTEAWNTSESLIGRTQQRQRVANAAEREREKERSRAYEALNKRYAGESDSDRENAMRPDDISDLEDYEDSISGDSEDDGPINVADNMRPNPLRLNPHTSLAPPMPARRPTILGAWGRAKGERNSSIQPDNQFYSKPYGELKSSTPPIMYGGDAKKKKKEEEEDGDNGDAAIPRALQGRHVSSGNDYDLLGVNNQGGYRRKVSGRAAEEGMAGPASTRYGVVNE